jgi:hypothetical protein
MKNLLFAFTFLTFLSFQTKAQDENCAACGFYIDGVKVEKIDCYSFDKLQIVLPFNNGVDGYDLVNIWIRLEETKSFAGRGYDGVKSVKGSVVKTLVKGNYIVYTVFAKDFGVTTQMKRDFRGGVTDDYPSELTTNVLPKKPSKKNPEGLHLFIWLEGATLTGYKEELNPAKNAIIKIPQYSVAKLSKRYSTLCVAETGDGSSCSYPGTKVDFNNLGNNGSSSNNSGNTNTTPTNNTTVKAETTVATAKTVITTVAPTSAAAVKPLDKTKPGYFEEKSDDKKFMYRNGYQTSPGTYHGEVREYDNNTLEKIITYTNGVEDGLYVIFSDGKLEWAGTYKNGKKEGAWKHYKNGVLEETEKYVNGVKQE